jgi:DNA-binding response OmpR family regulator
LRAPAESKVASSGAAILIVEDDADLAEMFGLGLSSADHMVRVAGRSTKELPVAMLTNSNDQALRARAQSLGILDWLVKSDTTPAELARRARAWTSAKEVTKCLNS